MHMVDEIKEFSRMGPKHLLEEILLFKFGNSRRAPDLKQKDYDFLLGYTENELSLKICERKCQVGHEDNVSESQSYRAYRGWKRILGCNDNEVLNESC